MSAYMWVHVCVKFCIARSKSEDDREGASVHVVGDIHMNILPLLVVVIALVILSLAARLLRLFVCWLNVYVLVLAPVFASCVRAFVR